MKYFVTKDYNFMRCKVTLITILLLSICLVFAVQLIVAVIEKKNEFKKSLFLIASIFAFLLSFGMSLDNKLPIIDSTSKIDTSIYQDSKKQSPRQNTSGSHNVGGGGGGGGGGVYKYTPTSDEQPLISKSQLEQVSVGMSYQNFIEIVGAEGVLVLENGSTKTYSYLRADNPSISIRFVFDNNILSAYYSR
jgi:hypothetical protein